MGVRQGPESGFGLACFTLHISTVDYCKYLGYVTNCSLATTSYSYIDLDMQNPKLHKETT